MALRIVSGVLWFLAGWFVTGLIAIGLGLNPAIAPLVGIVWAALIVIDPRDLVWRAGRGSSPSARTRGSNNPGARPPVEASF
jgi:hypothetical protein